MKSLSTAILHFPASVQLATDKWYIYGICNTTTDPTDCLTLLWLKDQPSSNFSTCEVFMDKPIKWYLIDICQKWPPTHLLKFTPVVYFFLPKFALGSNSSLQILCETHKTHKVSLYSSESHKTWCFQEDWPNFLHQNKFSYGSLFQTC